MLRHSAKSNSRGGARTGAGEATAKAKKEYEGSLSALSALCSKNGQGMRRGGREEMKMI